MILVDNNQSIDYSRYMRDETSLEKATTQKGTPMDYCMQIKGRMHWTQDDTITADRHAALRHRRLGTSFNEVEPDGFEYHPDFTVVEIDLGNNEAVSTGIFLQADGTYLAMTFTKSKEFKTWPGALAWLARRGY